MLTFTFIAVLLLAGLIPVVLGIRNAPEGYEDESGFHQGKPAEELRAEAVCVCRKRIRSTKNISGATAGATAT